MQKFIYKTDPSCSKTFIYGYGFTGKWLTVNIDKKVDGFIDTDIKKRGENFNGIKVYGYEDAKEILDDNSEVIVAAVDIFDVMPRLNKLKKKKVVAIGTLFNDEKVENNPTDELDSYIEYSLKTVEYSHKNYLDKNKLFIRSLDLVITERCSLKCIDCSNLMQYYKSPKNMDFENIKKEMDTLLNRFDLINEIRLIGGEPFMNKQIYEIIEWLCKIEKIDKIVIYTNATIPLKEQYKNILKNEKVIFSITDYGNLSKNTQKVQNFLDEYSISYRIHKPEYWTDSGRVVVPKKDKSVDELKVFFEDCCAKNLYTVLGDRIYRCPFVANADNLKAIPEDDKNFVSIYAPKNEIKHHLYETDYLPGCNFCKGRSFDSIEIKPAIQTKEVLNFKKLK